MGGNLTISKVIFNPKEKRIVLKGRLVCVCGIITIKQVRRKMLEEE
jgi:hypothetical protein